MNEDGKINAVDASKVLAEYALTSSGHESSFTEKQKKASDVDGNKKTDAVDASNILAYYAYISSSENYKTLSEYMKSR